ncbi:hypothetical protein RJ641_021658 [Dillenia turbinata]|uniref:Protein ECERIFERUM 2 n=1 Tax=Dillenia turbinata TaxID=194707 RepID=A0AAN8UR72_9MAGN
MVIATTTTNNNIKREGIVHDVKLSSVGTAKVTDSKLVWEPSNMDLAMKLHYLRGVYFFSSRAAEGLTIMKIKESMFFWLNPFYVICGRLRRSDSGRPYIKCNDSGVRFIEANSSKRLDDFLEDVKEESSLLRLLVSGQVIGPELIFSPTVLIQITTFKCGGISVGLSWAHVLGDAFSASHFINAWGQSLAHDISQDFSLSSLKPQTRTETFPNSIFPKPLSLKMVDPVGDHWIPPTKSKMDIFSFHLTATKLAHLQSFLSGQSETQLIPIFECLCAIVWHIVAKVQNYGEPRIVTVCKNQSSNGRREILGNKHSLSTVKAEFAVSDAEPKELAKLVLQKAVDERTEIEEIMNKENGTCDVIVYGANLTFVDMGEVNLYGLELKGEKPAFVNYFVDGVGDGGVILVLPGPENSGKNGGDGRAVTMILPDSVMLGVKYELKSEWNIA